MKLFANIWNHNYIKRNTVIQIVVVSIAFLLLVRIWPCDLVQKHERSKQQAIVKYEESVNDIFTIKDKKLQTVFFQNSHIYQMKVYMSCAQYQSGDIVLFRLYNQDFSCIYEEEYACSKIVKEHFLVATPDLDVDKNLNYYYEILIPDDNSEVEIYMPTANNSLLSQNENSTLYIDGILNNDISLITDFDYSTHLSILSIVLYDLIIVICTVPVYMGIIYGLNKADIYIPDIVRYGKWIATGFGGMLAIVIFIIAVVHNIFGGQLADRIVYTIGILAGTAWYMCAIWIPHEKHRPLKLSPKKQASLIWRNYIQVVCFGFLIYALCMYVNADREHYHYVNTRWMLIFLGIAILMIHSLKEWMNIPIYTWIGVSLVGSIFYCSFFHTEQDIYLAKLTAAVVVIWGVVVIYSLMQVRKQAWKSLNKTLGAIWLIFVICMVINRFQKTWPFTATLPFAVLLTFNLSNAQKSRLLKNFANGIILSFALAVVYCLHHRPYHYWIYYRYNMMFHTVASTGMYLSTVFAACIGKIYSKWNGRNFSFSKCWKELFLLAAVVCFMLFTMSRTAMLTMAVTVVLVAVLTGYHYKKSIRIICKEAAAMVLAVLCTFPMMFSAVRMVPAIAGEPVRYDLEHQDKSYMIYESDSIDSDKYMDINRFFNLFFYRLDITQVRDIRTYTVKDNVLAYIGHERLPIKVENTEEKYVLEQGSEDISNGRFEIFMAYLKNLNWRGHEKMTTEEIDSGHAHNSYIQVAYDFGIIAGVVFLVLCAYTLIQSVLLFKKQGNKYGIFIVPFALIVNFGFMSVTEWAFHPCIPAGFCFLFVQMLLMQEGKTKKG